MISKSLAVEILQVLLKGKKKDISQRKTLP